MRVGLFHTVQWPEGTAQESRYQSALAQAVLAEELGFDSVWLTEHHFFRHGIISDSLAVLAYLAARTSRIRLGTAVAVLPLHHPVRLAEAVATVDQLSGGRFDFGIGKGYQVGEFKGLGVNADERNERFEEGLEIILKGLTTEEPFSFEGRFWQLDATNPQPKPLQQPHPPIWLATDSDSGLEMVAERGWGLLLPQGRSPEYIAATLARYRRLLEKVERPWDPDKVVLARALYVGETDAAAWADVEVPYTQFVERAASLAAPGQKLAAVPDSPFTLDADLRSSAIFGSPDTCVSKLRELESLGIERIIGFVHIGGLTHEQVVASLRRCASDVLPRVSREDAEVLHAETG